MSIDPGFNPSNSGLIHSKMAAGKELATSGSSPLVILLYLFYTSVETGPFGDYTIDFVH